MIFYREDMIMFSGIQGSEQYFRLRVYLKHVSQRMIALNVFGTGGTGFFITMLFLTNAQRLRCKTWTRFWGGAARTRNGSFGTNRPYLSS
jgi:hypothetical protein